MMYFKPLKIHEIVFILSNSALFLFYQTVQTLIMKCRLMQHCIWVFTVCTGIQNEKGFHLSSKLFQIMSTAHYTGYQSNMTVSLTIKRTGEERLGKRWLNLPVILELLLSV